MKPALHVGKMTDLSKRKQNEICKCPVKCAEYVIMIGHDDFMLCKNEAREHAYDVLRVLGYMVPKRTMDAAALPYWTTKELKKVREYVLEHGSHDGMYNVLELQLGRSKAAIKKQVIKMRKDGDLPQIKRG